MPRATIEELFARQRGRKPLEELRERAIAVLNACVDLTCMQGTERELFRESRRRLHENPDCELPAELCI